MDKGIYFGKLFAPVGSDFLGMQADHRIEAVGILAAEFEDCLRRFQVDGRHENLFYASLASALDDLGKVVAKFLAV